MTSVQNRILEPGYTRSTNFFQSDRILRHYLQHNCSEDGYKYMLAKWKKLGKQAAVEMDKLSMTADKQSPVLKKRNYLGEEINEIEFHPAYRKLTAIAIESELFKVKWDDKLREQFDVELHTLGFGSGYLFVMGEVGLFCPLCMTDGVARIINNYGEEEDKARLLPKIAATAVEDLMTGAMFLTEKAGGSDVGANLVSASHFYNKYYHLNGEKWFCSNANAELILALARTDGTIKGTKGLSIFLIEKINKDGTANYKNIVRLKDKIGVRSMASAEIILDDTVGKRIGEEGQGFQIMADMINLSRVYNSVTASAIIRRVLVEAYQYLSYRKTFGKIALDHALVRDKLAELAAIHQANFYLTWRTIKALDHADNGNQKEKHLVRLLTPMLKKCTAYDSVYACREAMEAIGGLAYIEEHVVPKFLRDALVLPIWEGAGNIMTLDMLRASIKSSGLAILIQEAKRILAAAKDDNLLAILDELDDSTHRLLRLPKDEMELNAKYFFEELGNIYKIALLYENRDEVSKEWIDLSIKYLKQHYFKSRKIRMSLTRNEVEKMIAWVF